MLEREGPCYVSLSATLYEGTVMLSSWDCVTILFNISDNNGSSDSFRLVFLNCSSQCDARVTSWSK